MPLGNIEYLGGDIVDDLIRANDKFTTDKIQFKRLNLIESPLPEMDLIFVRDCLVHLTNKDITRSLQNICDSNSRYLLTTLFSDCGRTLNIVTGQWRELNLTLEPFNLPEPIKLINENHIHDRHKDKCLALWEVSVIRKALS